ncbi:MAG: phosphoglucosamine mutase, partial [Actinomycetota bacterium]
MSLSFGTDGMRGDARDVLTPVPVRALARAAADVLGASGFAVGRDPRESGPAL